MGIDADAARELDLYAENTAELYPQFMAIIRNIQRRVKNGTYDATKAPKLWRYWYDEAARRYCKEFACTMRVVFPVVVRQYCAEERAKEEYEKIINGEYSA